MLKQMFYLVTVATLATACSAHRPNATAMKETQASEEKQTQAQQKPALSHIDSAGTDLHIYKYDGRIYVIGSEETRADFEQHKHLPYTKTLLGAGPNGETVIFEVDKSDAAYADSLIDEYNSIPWVLEENATYTAWKYQGRIYVIGNAETNASFARHKHLPYTKTILGAGPGGETVIFEVDKKDPEFADRLRQAYMSN
ncbi:MAG: hypothetical protein ABR516_06255 [Desulfuromonadaceae bacterium]